MNPTEQDNNLFGAMSKGLGDHWTSGWKNSMNNGLNDGSNVFKLWLEGQQAAFQAMLATSGSSDTASHSESAVTGPDMPLQQLRELWKNSADKWLSMSLQQTEGQSQEEALRKLFDPKQWIKIGQDPFHDAIEHLNSGPSFATLWELDKKMLRAQQLRLEQERNLNAYHEVVRKGWKKAYGLFIEEVNNEAEAPIKSWREMADLWVKIANDVMMQMHRAPEFLEAQRRMTRSATEYRLQEREIVEAFCEAHHIPTRTEVDEVQHTVHELRRQVRILQRQMDLSAQSQSASTVQTKPMQSMPTPTAVKPGAKPRATAKPQKTVVALTKTTNRATQPKASAAIKKATKKK